MSYKTIVTVVRNGDRDSNALSAAISFAEAWSAHLEVMALGTDRVQPGAYYAGAAAMAIQSAMTEAIEEAKEAEASARERLRVAGCAWEVMPGVAQIGALGQIVARHAGLADLVILPKPYGDGRTAEDVAILEAALFATRTPVLVLPDGMDTAPKYDKVVLAWNQGAEALAAVRSALPILKEASTVDITIIDPPEHDPDRSDPGGALAAMLARHEVRAEISVLAKTMPKISDVLLRHAQDSGADMIVMGAYGHSRFREAILGGATRNMLSETNLPVLMAH
ncbi:MAG: universal stress protein [Paracoccaceae bacterium]|nr:universal stress protein [Paracoccaceae bacterium]